MKRILGGLALAALICVGGVSAPVTASGPARDRCTFAEIQRFVHAGFEVARLSFNHPDASPGAAQADHIWDDCQFRFYDNNDEDNPEVPHVFSEDDYFLAGVFIFYFHEDLSGEFDRADAIADMAKSTDRFFWGPSTATDSELQEMAITYGPYKDGLLPLGPAVGAHWYIIFPPGSQEPGEYRWRYEQYYEGELGFVANGAVIITPAE